MNPEMFELKKEHFCCKISFDVPNPGVDSNDEFIPVIVIKLENPSERRLQQLRPNKFTEKGIYLYWKKDVDSILVSSVSGNKIMKVYSAFPKDFYSPGHVVNCEYLDKIFDKRRQRTVEEKMPVIYRILA